MSYLNIITTTGLATAIAVGGFYHFKLIREYQSKIHTLQQQLETLRPMPGLDTQSIGRLVGQLKSEPEKNNTSEWVYGAANARYTLVEMTDTECPYCRQHFPILKGLIDSSGGHINAALLHVPAHGEASRNQALAIECAGEQGGADASWKYAERLFSLTQSNGKGVSQSLAGIATTLTLDGKRFAACMESIPAIDRVKTDLEQALKLGVTQTPSTLVMDNQTGRSLILQGANASRDGILNALKNLSAQGVNHE